MSPSGEALGRVAAVFNHGAGDILEIAPAGGGATMLLAFTRGTTPEIDFQGGRIVVVPPPEIEARPEDEA